MSLEQEQEIEQENECRLCVGNIEIDTLCDDHQKSLQDIVDCYQEPNDLMENIDNDVIYELLDSNNIQHIIDGIIWHELEEKMYEKIKNVMRQYAETTNLEEEKQHFFECGYENEDFAQFFFYPLFSREDFESKLI